MKYVCTLLALIVMTVASLAVEPAHSQDKVSSRVTLYTPLLRGDGFNCNAVNVTHKTDGHLISPDQGNPATVPVPPATAAVFPTITPPADQSPDEGYCKFEVIGTDDANAIRVDLSIVLTRTFGANNDIPVLVFRTGEGH